MKKARVNNIHLWATIHIVAIAAVIAALIVWTTASHALLVAVCTVLLCLSGAYLGLDLNETNFIFTAFGLYVSSFAPKVIQSLGQGSEVGADQDVLGMAYETSDRFLNALSYISLGMACIWLILTMYVYVMGIRKVSHWGVRP